MPTVDLSFDELNVLLYKYDYSDRQIARLVERTVDAFANCKLLIRSTFYDSRKTVAYARKLYGKLWRDCKRTLLRIGKHYWSECDDEWLYLFLTDYDPVFKVVYENEQDRKRARFVEGVLASDTITSKKEFIDRAMRVWLRMVQEMGVEVTDRAMIDKYKEDGVKKVMWVTAEDDRVCLECDELNGEIFPINKVPPKPHINCRCRLIPVRD